ncbi:MAG TPA: aminodeoxychorismate lyase [Solimonas sp.]|nr:aminodeoxychorismate lyase [Solimonas sp.]
MSALLNGGPLDAAQLAHSRALHYGDGVFRTLLVWQGQALDLPAHLDKLAHDAQRIGLAAPPRALIEREAGELAAGQPSAVLKIILASQAGSRGYRPGTDACDRLLLRYASPQHPQDHWRRGIRLFRSEVQLAEQPLLAGIKHLNRLEQVLASRNWPDGADEGILCDRAGRPVGGTRTNLFWVAGGELLTPALETCGVEGIMRNKIIEIARSLQVSCRVGMQPWAALEAAGEMFVSNAVIGLWPVRQLEAQTLAAPGPVTSRLMAALGHPLGN